jgi:O-antigen/teichoic acid export membrane protein
VSAAAHGADSDRRPALWASTIALVGAGVRMRAAGVAIAGVAGIVTTSLAVRLLDAQAYGVLAFALSAASLLAVALRLGLEPALTRTVAADESESAGQLRAVRGGTTVALAAACATGLLVTPLVLAVGGSVGQATALVVAGAVAIHALAANAVAVATSAARGRGRVALMEVPNVVLSLAKVALVAVLAVLAVHDLGTVVLAYAGGALVGLVVALRIIVAATGDRGALRPSGKAGRQLAAVSLPFAVVAVSTIVVSRFDVIVLGLVRGPVDVAVYEPTLRLVEQAVLVVPLLFVGPFLPAATRLLAAGDTAAFRRLHADCSALVYVLAFPVLTLFAAYPEAALRLVYGSGFAVRRDLAVLLVAAFAVTVSLALNTSALTALGARRPLVAVGATGIVSMVVLAPPLVASLGAPGAALATLGSYVAVNAMLVIRLKRAAAISLLTGRRAVLVTTSLAALAVAIALRIPLDASSASAALSATAAVSAVWILLVVRLRLGNPATWRGLAAAAAGKPGALEQRPARGQ